MSQNEVQSHLHDGASSNNSSSLSFRSSFLPLEQSLSLTNALDKCTGLPKSNSSKSKRQVSKYLHFETHGRQVHGILFLKILSISNLPSKKKKNFIRTSLEMNPFVIVSFGNKAYKTNIIRRTSNPTFNQNIALVIFVDQLNYRLEFRAMDRDQFSLNDSIGRHRLNIKDLISVSKLPGEGEDLFFDPEMFQSVPLELSSQYITSRSDSPLYSSSNDSHAEHTNNELDDFGIDGVSVSQSSERKNTNLQFSSRFIHFDVLFHKFWIEIMRNFDPDESNQLTIIELTSLLDSLGATLSDVTIHGFFRKFNLSPEDESSKLTFEQTISCLKEFVLSPSSIYNQRSSLIELRERIHEYMHPESMKPKYLYNSNSSSIQMSSPTILSKADSPESPLLPKDTMNHRSISSHIADKIRNISASDPMLTEKLITLTNCPFCQQETDFDDRSDLDAILHMASCVCTDWNHMDRLIVSSYVTASQASRNWYMKILHSVVYGGYKPESNPAILLVQNRRTGRVFEERMSVHVRLGIRLMYKGLKANRMESQQIRKLLRYLTMKQGRKYDSPASKKDIPNFIRFHKIDETEFLLPWQEYATFNEFFFRQLKPSVRPLAEPLNSKVVLSPTDSRMVCFNTIQCSQKFWIKGQEFSISRMLGLHAMSKHFTEGSIAIFRLAPQDYHRFHSPVDGIVLKPKKIEGDYYTVNPMAVRSSLDVYGENARIVLPIQTTSNGLVMLIAVGAMMVGSTLLLIEPGQKVCRGQELGYFKFGGSTIVLLFERNKISFDTDLLLNSENSLETYLHVGDRVAVAL